MSRESTLILLGSIVLLSPFAGLPISLLSWLLPVLGLITLGIGISLRAERRKAAPSHEASLSTSS